MAGLRPPHRIERRDRGLAGAAMSPHDVHVSDHIEAPRRQRRPRRRRDTCLTRLGLTQAREEGRVGGRPSVVTREMLERARELRAGGATYTQIATELGVGKTTIRRALTTET